MVLFEEPEGAQSFDAGGDLGGVRELASGEGVLVDGNSRVGGLGSVGGGFCMVMRLKRCCQHKASGHAARNLDRTLVRGAESMVPFRST